MRARLALLIGAATLAVFARAVGNGFVNFDDEIYITANPHVLSGLSWASFSWALTSFDASNWHPLTWLSHMLDVSLFGVNPVGHHAVNVLLHGVSAALVFLLFETLTGRQRESAAAAALFALHPLRVESVAWASQRKDVLALLLGLLTLLAYVAQVRRGRGRATTLVLFALGLAAKPTLVCLPVLMLLLDFWPLERARQTGRKPRSPASLWRRLAAEKLPFFLLAAASTALTIAAQRSGGATRVLDVPPAARLGNAAVSIARYLGKTAAPIDLAAVYPYPASWPLWQIGAALALVAAVTAAAVRLRQGWPFLLFGWLWFLAALLPTLGVVQVGWQSMADRYTNLASIGLAVALVWTVSAVCRPPAARVGAAALLAVVLAALSVATFRQIGVWKDSLTLWDSALARTRDNPAAELNDGAALLEVGRAAEALPHFEAGRRLAPASAHAAYALGAGLEALGRTADGRRQYAEALRLSPGFPPARRRLAELDRE